MLEDGVQLPSLYVIDDISLQQSDSTFTPSAIKFINGKDTTTYLTQFHTAGLSKVLIDLQQNLGGDTLLAVDTFKHFLPSNDTFSGSRLRAQPLAGVIGNTFTTFFQDQKSKISSVYDDLRPSDFVSTSRIDVETNQDFTSWAQFLGPHPFNGDFFTTVQRENMSNSLFDDETLGIDIYGASVPATPPRFYTPENIILLTHGLRSSACAVFVEMMHHEAGIKAVTVGGLPSAGPMQNSSGTRGAQIYLAENIDDDISVAEGFNVTTIGFLPDREFDTWIDFLSVNLRDQIWREDSESDGTPWRYAPRHRRPILTLRPRLHRLLLHRSNGFNSLLPSPLPSNNRLQRLLNLRHLQSIHQFFPLQP